MCRPWDSRGGERIDPAQRRCYDNDTRSTPPADPREAGPKPEYPHKPIQRPGHEAELTPRADHGEESYVGVGRGTDPDHSLDDGTRAGQAVRRRHGVRPRSQRNSPRYVCFLPSHDARFVTGEVFGATGGQSPF
jgi:hypothetical protein